MKKLIMAAAIAATVAANAASVSWSASGFLYDGAETPAKVTSQPVAYLVYSAGLSQSDLVDAFSAANGDAAATLTAMNTSGAVATGTGAVNASSKLSGTSTYAQTADANVYAVIFDSGKMFLSSEASSLYDSVTGDATASLGSLSTISKSTFDAASGFSAAGWYTASVPEPTSGLLMLLGMAGLALRRRRA